MLNSVSNTLILYVSVVFQDITEDEKEEWVSLASGEKRAIDSAFRRLFAKQLLCEQLLR
jgi:hypothetical protein